MATQVAIVGVVPVGLSVAMDRAARGIVIESRREDQSADAKCKTPFRHRGGVRYSPYILGSSHESVAQTINVSGTPTRTKSANV
jgi:hypothetical protein